MTWDIERHAAEIERDGYTIMERVLPQAEMDATRAAIEETLAAEETIGRKYGLQSANLRMVFNAQAKHRHFHGLPLRYPAPVEVAQRVLGDDMFAHDVTIRVPMPTGEKDHRRFGGNLHADWSDFTVKPFIGGRHYAMGIQAAWALTEFSTDNRRAGGLARVAPRRRDPTRGAGHAPAGMEDRRSARRIGAAVGCRLVAHRRHQSRQPAALLADPLLPALVGEGLQRLLSLHASQTCARRCRWPNASSGDWKPGSRPTRTSAA